MSTGSMGSRCALYIHNLSDIIFKKLGAIVVFRWSCAKELKQYCT
jgi:hypothetical protein